MNRSLAKSIFGCTLTMLSALASAQLSVVGGSPRYTQAIDVPPGAHGLAPKLSLNYADLRDGPEGLGWSLQGTSMISRCQPSLATDNTHGAVNFDGNDKLCLDGQRLIPLDGNGNPLVGVNTGDSMGSASGAYIEFRTEKDSYSRIRSYGLADGANVASGPAYFKIWTKDGRIMELGNDPAASDGNTQAVVMPPYPTGVQSAAQVWALSRISDTFGNFVDFKYYQRDVANAGSQGTVTSGHEMNLAEIQYSGNKVVFSYTDRVSGVLGDRSEAYNKYTKNVSIRQLNAITTYVNSPNTTVLGPATGANGAVPAKTFNLSYSTGPVTGRLLLTSIKTCAGGPTSTKCLPPTVLNYSPGSTDTYQANASFNLANTTLYSSPEIAGPYASWSFSDTGTAVADLNGDGRADILVWSPTPSQNQLWTSNGDGSFTKDAAFNITSDVLVDHGGCNQIILRDFNGDGLIDILRFTEPAGSAPSGDGTGSPGACPGNGPSLLFINNGDGTFTRHEISGVTLDYEPGGTYSIIVDGMTHAATYNYQAANFWLIDVDGDGILDIVTSGHPCNGPDYCSASQAAQYPNGVYTHVYKGDGSGNFTDTPTNLANVDIFSSGPIAAPTIDFNSDGLDDLLQKSCLPVTAIYCAGNVYQSNGDGNFTSLGNVAQVAASSLNLTMDYNGDGRPDYFYADYGIQNLIVHDNSSTLYSSAVSNSNLANSDPQAGPFIIKTGLSSVLGQALAADFNGDGRSDLLTFGGSLYLSNGDGTFTLSSTFVKPAGLVQTWADTSEPGASAQLATFLMGDFTGSGYPEFLEINSQGANTLFTRTSTQRPDLLTSVTSSSGAVSTLSYFPISNPNQATGAALGPRYTTDRLTINAAVLPAVDTIGPMYVVSTLTTDSGVSTPMVTEFSYAGLKSDTKGRGSLGFRQILQQTYAADGGPVTAASQFAQVFPYTGMPVNSAVYPTALNVTASAAPLSDTQTIYCDQTAPAGSSATAISSGVSCPSTGSIHRPYAAWSKQTGTDLVGDNLPSTTVQRTVDADGDPTQVVTTVTLTGSSTDTFTETANSQYWPDNTSCSAVLTCQWILGRVQTATTERAVPSAMVTTSPGTGPYAKATAGTGSLEYSNLVGIAFGGVAVGSAPTQTAQLTNNGVDPLTLTVPTSASVTGAGFSFVSTTCAATLAPQSNCTVSVMFTPTNDVGYSGNLSLSTGTGTLSSTLTGTGQQAQLSFNPSSLAWGSRLVNGTYTSSTVTLSNNGNIAANGLTMSALPSGFTFNTNNCGATLAPNGSNGSTCTFTVNWTPTVAQAYGGTLSVTTSTGIASGAVTLSASAVAAPTLSAVTLNPTTATTGNNATLTWTTGGGATSSAATCSGAATGSGTSSPMTVSTTGTGTGACTVTATNSIGTQVQSSANLVVVAAPTVTSASVSAANVTTGSTNTLSWSIGGGATSGSVTCSGAASGSGTSSPTTIGTTGTGTGTCTVTATNAAGTQVSASPTFQVVAAPTVASASFSAANVTTGNTTSLSWTLGGGATSVSATCSGAATGAGTASPITVGTTGTGTGTCTITATNAAGTQVSYSPTFQVVAAPTITSASYSAANVTTGGSNALSWVLGGGAASAAVSCSGAATGSGTTSPLTAGTTGTGTGTCVVTASNAAGTRVTSSPTFQVVAAPTVASASYSAANVTTGGSDTLTWSVGGGATSGSVSCSGAATGSGTSSPTGVGTTGTGTGTCVVTATNAAGTQVTSSPTFQVVAAPTVASASFSAANVTTGGSNSLTWSLGGGATNGSVSCSGAATGSGTTSPTAVGTTGTGTGACTITATNAAGTQVTASPTFNVVAAPTVASASYSAANVTTGGSNTLTWSVGGGATSGSVSCSGAATGSGTSSPTTIGTTGTGSGTCVVTATNAAGSTASSSVSFNVVVAPSVTSNTTPAYMTAQTGTTVSWAVANAVSSSGTCSGNVQGSGTGTSTGGSLTATALTPNGPQNAMCSITATNAAGTSVVSSTYITVVAAASVTSNLSKTSGYTGSSVSFSWTPSNATSSTASCSGAGVSVSNSTSNPLSVTPTQVGTLTCTATALNSAATPATASASETVTQAPTDTLPWTNGSTLSFCSGQYATPNHTYSFAVNTAAEVVTVSPSNAVYTVTPSGWTSGTSVAPGTYTVKIAGVFGSTTTAPITITFAGTGDTSTATVYAYNKATCP